MENQPSKDYVTYTITAEELRLMSEYEKARFKSANRESLYVRVHKVLGEKERGVFTIGGIAVSNGAMVGVEPVSIVYRRPLKVTEKATDFEEGVVVDGQVECVAQVDTKSPLGTRLLLAAMVFGPVYAALASQYSMGHIYHMAGRLAEGVVVDDPSTYIVYDQNTASITSNPEDVTETVVYNMTYAANGQTAEAVTRFPVIVARVVRESDHSTNFGEVFPIIRRGNKVAFNGYIPYDCIFVEPAFYHAEDGGEDCESLNDNYQSSFRDSLIFINDVESLEHVDRKFGRVMS